MLFKGFSFSIGCLALSWSAGAVAATSSSNSSDLSFGQHYAVLNLDLIEALVSSVNTTDEGKKWINNTATWIDAVHQQNPPPLSIFTRIFYSNSMRPEVSDDVPFWQAVSSLGNVTEKSPESQLYSAFKPKDDWDVILRKSRYYAGDGNSLEEILRTQKIDTVVLSGIRTSGVILSTAYRLFDLNYNVYVIANNTLEPDSPDIADSILDGILPKMPVSVITIEEALGALKSSGPAVY